MASFRGSGFILAVIFLVATTVTCADEPVPVRYYGHQLLRVVPENELQLRTLVKQQYTHELDFWIEPRAVGHPVDIFVSPEKIPLVSKLLRAMRLKAEVLMDDADAFIQEASSFRDANDFDWKSYHKLESINAWLTEQARKYPQIASIITAGTTGENRTLTGLRIAHKPNQPVVFIEAGVHAREWITPATATWIIQQVLDSKSDLVQSYEWHIFPSINPDGYAYTQTDRFWRKNRRKLGSCSGVDTNRNWPYKWQGGGNGCSETYPGSEAISEPEIQGLVSYLQSLAKRTKIYISLHSYSQLLMYPWGYTAELPSDNKRLYQVAQKAVAKLSERYGTLYRFGPIATTIYKAYGNTVDFAYSLKIPFAFAFELRDTGKYGFALPPDQIIPTAEETFDAFNVILEEAKK